MVLVYCPEESTRLNYTLDLLLGEILGLPFRVTSFHGELMEYVGPKLNYSFEEIPEIPFIRASGLLFERGIRNQSERLKSDQRWKELPTLFPVPPGPDPSRSLPFDLLSAIFYLVTRYEEHLPFEPDPHQRFPSGESLALRSGFLDRPIINEWALAFAGFLSEVMEDELNFHFPSYRFIPTIDIDNAFAYKNKGWRRTIGGQWNDLSDTESRNYRYQVLRGNQHDPYDTYALLARFHQQAGVCPVWFFLLGDYGPYDKNPSYRNPAFQKLIRHIAAAYPVGIHPAYAANSSAQIRREIERLELITGDGVIRSRQHYLRLPLPQTYRLLAHLGIREEYSMGYSDRTGFRAGIALPYRFFDLEENIPMDLVIHPFQVMDTTLMQNMKFSPEGAISHALDLIKKTREVGGTFSTLWHNESLSEWRGWQGWSEVYRQILLAAG